jgi:hypothetical protein
MLMGFDGARCWWHSWLRHCATGRKVAGSIPDGVTGIFHLRNPSGRTMALRLIQPLTEMSNKAKVTLEQATKACRGSRDIALLFL